MVIINSYVTQVGKSQNKDSSNQLTGISFFGKETQENTSLESRLSEDDVEDENEESDEEQASGKRKRTKVDEPVKTAHKKKKGAKKQDEGKSSSVSLFCLLTI